LAARYCFALGSYSVFIFCVEMAFGEETWRFGEEEIWRCGDLEMWIPDVSGGQKVIEVRRIAYL